MGVKTSQVLVPLSSESLLPFWRVLLTHGGPQAACWLVRAPLTCTDNVPTSDSKSTSLGHVLFEVLLTAL